MKLASGLRVYVVAGTCVAAGLAGCQQQGKSGSSKASTQRVAIAPQSESEKAWEDLRAGNMRYVQGRPMHPNQTVERREGLVSGQSPKAVVLSCSDSRVPPEILFDTGLGDLFVIRVAGNTADPAAIASIEYAVDNLHVPLIVVLGHEGCGAVSAAVSASTSSQPPAGHLEAILQPLEPAVAMARSQQGDLVENAMQDNVRVVVEQLKTCEPILSEAVGARKVQVMGCRYELKSGEVRVVGKSEP